MKKLKLKGEDIKPLLEWDGPSGCIATDKITVEGFKIGYMYRENQIQNIQIVAGDSFKERKAMNISRMLKTLAFMTLILFVIMIHPSFHYWNHHMVYVITETKWEHLGRKIKIIKKLAKNIDNIYKSSIINIVYWMRM